MRAVKGSLGHPALKSLISKQRARVSACSCNARSRRPSPGLLARLGVPVGGRVGKGRAVGDHLARPQVSRRDARNLSSPYSVPVREGEQRSIQPAVFSPLNLDLSLNLPMGCPLRQSVSALQPVERIDSSRVFPRLDCVDAELICVSISATFYKNVLLRGGHEEAYSVRSIVRPSSA